MMEVKIDRTNSFAAARGTSQRCGPLPNYFAHLLSMLNELTAWMYALHYVSVICIGCYKLEFSVQRIFLAFVLAIMAVLTVSSALRPSYSQLSCWRSPFSVSWSSTSPALMDFMAESESTSLFAIIRFSLASYSSHYWPAHT